MAKLDLSKTPDYMSEIKTLLKAGKRKDGATIAMRYSTRLEGDDLRALVQILSEELGKAGDKGVGRRRPSLSETDPMKGRLHKAKIWAARSEIADAITARKILEGRAVAVEDLAYFAFECGFRADDCVSDDLNQRRANLQAAIDADTKGALDLLIPFAKAILKKYGLANAPKQGFKGYAKEKILAHFGVTPDQLKVRNKNTGTKSD
jgi:hypothetical protein